MNRRGAVATRDRCGADGDRRTRPARQSLPRGGRVPYTVTLTNRGNTSIRAIWVHLFASKPGHAAIPAKNLTYISFRTTRGRCHRQIYFAEHKGVMCAIGPLEPGQKAVITAKVRLRESITHWTSLDYSPGTGASSSDDNTRNDQRKLTTRVRR